MNKAIFGIAAFLALVGATSAGATTFSVTSAISDSLHGGSNDHAVHLKFFEKIQGTPLYRRWSGSDFDFIPAGTFVIDENGNAQISGQIVSQVDPRFAFDVMVDFIGLNGPGSGGPKKELRSCAYGGSCGDIDPSSWEYFSLSSGTFTGTGALEGLSFAISEKPVDTVYPFQLGVGANGKNGNLGAASWFYLFLNDDCDNPLCDDLAAFSVLHGDFNIDLIPTPLPAGLLLFGSGLIGLASVKKRQKKA